MSLLKKPTKKKKMRLGGAANVGVSTKRATQVLKQAPCMGHCPSGNNVRDWVTLIQLRDKNKMSLEQACDAAWKAYVETNPFPAIMGRVCPHPCEDHCNRKEKDGAVGINSVERFLGDWGIERKLELEKLDVGGPFEDKIAVVGAGPAGLQVAYQLARRGYPVTVFEDLPESGGMLRYGIPEYRLPRHVIDAEVERIAKLGVEIKYNTRIGRDISFEQLRNDYAAVFLGLGAHQGRNLRCAGEEGPFVYTGTGFLRKANIGEPPPLGKKVVVIGGGDTAIDAARVALRINRDAEVTILYRRTRVEMPAIDPEIEEALAENIKLVLLEAPAEILRDDKNNVRAMIVQRMELGEPDSSGRRRPVPIDGDTYELECDTVITAVSQQPDSEDLGDLGSGGRWLAVKEHGKAEFDNVWSAGDCVWLGIATEAIGKAREAAEAMHYNLRKEEIPHPDPLKVVGPDRIKMSWYKDADPQKRTMTPVAERWADVNAEIDHGLSQEQTLAEADRCFSCGSCFYCENCWMYCTPGCFSKLPEPSPGTYYKLDIATCDGCTKCADECPCGYLDMI